MASNSPLPMVPVSSSSPPTSSSSTSLPGSGSYKMELRVGGKYRLGKKIGSGSFGDIYLGHHILTGEEVAIKLESIKSRHQQLSYEYRLYRLLQGKTPGQVATGIPNVRWFGKEGDYNVLIMDLLGPSLEDLFNYVRHRTHTKHRPRAASATRALPLTSSLTSPSHSAVGCEQCNRSASISIVLTEGFLTSSLISPSDSDSAVCCCCCCVQEVFAEDGADACGPAHLAHRVHPQQELHTPRYQAGQLPHRSKQEGNHHLYHRLRTGQEVQRPQGTTTHRTHTHTHLAVRFSPPSRPVRLLLVLRRTSTSRTRSTRT